MGRSPIAGILRDGIDPHFLVLSALVPTLSEWSLIAMAALVLLVGIAFLRSRNSRRPAA